MKLSAVWKRGLRRLVARVSGEDGLIVFEGWSHTISHLQRRWGLRHGEPDMAALPRVVRRGDLCLDIGANVGAYTSLLSAMVGAEGAVLAFEPVGYTHRILARVVRHLRLRNVTLYRVALGAEVGELQMAIPSLKDAPRLMDTPSAHIASGKETNARLERVPVTTLDRLSAEFPPGRVAFVKCDTEGAERAIFRGGRELLTRHRPAVLSEVDGRHTARYGHSSGEVFALFHELGYGAYQWDGREMRPVSAETASPGNCWFLPETAERT